MSDDALALFFAHSIELEREAQERYAEFAQSMATHHNAEVAAFFRRMVDEAAQHLAEVSELAQGMQLPTLHAWEFDWPDVESPETANYEALHYRMSLRDAMQIALDNERAAERYYRGCADGSDDARVTRIAGEFADEEASHAAQLEVLLSTAAEPGEFYREEDDAPVMPE
jgi:rubrerythrin